jgi:hypothetical protein
MRNRVLRHIRSNVVAYVALFVALGGTSYAALRLPANSVGTRQIKNHSITPIKLDPSKTAAVVRFWAIVDSVPGNGEQVITSRPRARITAWDPSTDTGALSWHQSISPKCFVQATSGTGFARAFVEPLPGSRAVVQFSPFTTSGQHTTGLVYIAVSCPLP